MLSWSQFTIEELRKILNENLLGHQITLKCRKNDLVTICEKNLDKSVLISSCSRFTKESSGRSKSRRKLECNIDYNTAESKGDKFKSLSGSQQPIKVSIPYHRTQTSNRSVSEQRIPNSSLEKIRNNRTLSQHSFKNSKSLNYKADQTKSNRSTSKTSKSCSDENYIEENSKDYYKTLQSQHDAINIKREFIDNYIHEQKHKKIKKLVHKIFWGRIVFLGIMCLIFYLLYIYYKNNQVLNRFCEKDQTANDWECVKCPENAICDQFNVRCIDQNHILTKHKNKLICKFDKKSYLRAELLLKKISDQLSKNFGNFICFKKMPLNGMRFEISKNDMSKVDYIGYTEDSIKNQFLSDTDLPSDIALVFNELLTKTQVRKNFNIETTILSNSSRDITSSSFNHSLVKVYYATEPKKTILCYLMVWALTNKRQNMLFIVSLILCFCKFRYNIQEVANLKLIKQIISENTTVQESNNGFEYAHGPTSYIVHQLLNIKHKNNISTMNKSSLLSISTVERLCNKLHKSDISICRNFLSTDRKPYFFDKLVFDELYLKRSYINKSRL